MRRFVPLILPLAAALLAGCAARTRVPVAAASDGDPGASVVALARSLIGTPYHNGGASPAGFDCSGFVQFVFGELGVRVPRSVQDQWTVGRAVERSRVRPGDLVFFAIDGRAVSHVGIAAGGDTFVHAPSSRGLVREESLSLTYWKSRFRGARRLAAR